MLKNINAFSSFSVDNLEKAKKFYTMLGLKLSEDSEMLWLNIGNNKIFIYPKENHVPATYTILNFPVQNIDQVIDELGKQGVQFEHYDRTEIKTDEKGIFHGPGHKIAWFKDPAGNILSVLEEE